MFTFTRWYGKQVQGGEREMGEKERQRQKEIERDRIEWSRKEEGGRARVDGWEKKREERKKG